MLKTKRPGVLRALPLLTLPMLASALLLSTPTLAAAPLVLAADAASQSADIDRQAWNEASMANTAAAYQAYVEAFPNGAYVGLAKVRLATLRNGGSGMLIQSVTAQKPAEAVRVVKIGHVGPLTGQIAHLGQDNENGARMAIEELNTQDIVIGGQHIQFELVGKDDGANPAAAVAVAHSLVDAGVVGVVGHLNSGTTIPASKVYFENGIPQLSPSATNPYYTKQGFNTAFRLITNDEDLADMIGQYGTNTYHPSKVVVVSDGTAYGNGVGMTFQRHALSAGEQIVDRITISSKQTDFSKEAERISSLAPDLVYFAGMDAQAGPLLRAIHATGADPYFGGADGICTEALPRMTDNASKVFCGENGGVSATKREDMRLFRERYRARFGKSVMIFAPNAYDGVKILVQAMRNADSVEPMRYLPALKSINYAGVAANYQFNQNGDDIYRTVSMYGYRNGQRVILSVVDGQ